jgi:hypothetical protein
MSYREYDALPANLAPAPPTDRNEDNERMTGEGLRLLSTYGDSVVVAMGDSLLLDGGATGQAMRWGGGHSVIVKLDYPVLVTIGGRSYYAIDVIVGDGAIVRKIS